MRAGRRSRSASQARCSACVDPIEIVESEAELGDGQTLLLYTDGVPEAGRARGQLGEQGLLELCAKAPRVSLGGLLEHIERGALERAGDDCAMTSRCWR